LVLETRVEERTAELAHTNVELRKAQERLIQTSRQAGMAEVANGVLHNIGNVLNSVNVSTSVIGEKLQGFPVADLAKAAEMIDKHREDLAQFLTADTRGRHLPDYLSEVAKLLGRENAALLEELSSLTHGVDHIKQIVQMQQSYAKVSTLREPVNPASLIDDAIRLNLLSLERHNIRIERHLADIEMVNIDRHKILQILTNLISNAKNALKDAHTAEGSAITINLDRIELNGSEAIRFQVIDNGVGIPAENMERIFSHGFTTRDNGHGFGLHSSINAAREMGGSLTAASDGPGRGATFTLDIPTGAEAAIAK
jgi:signal transduction histidine kinase